MKRVIYIAIGLVLIGLGAFTRTINGSQIQPWRRVLLISGGLFVFYCGVMYYLPRYRRRRQELNDFLNDAGRGMRGHGKSR
ncbi:MAG: hypothetical protein JOY62_01940 [Acidobacteriaceae bacterium]|nr:hypothetical protein [Acidobacteriaceae bacterium]MBV9778709.1 hypothetical protein [Acidobacteriaceae bacterium]